MGFRKKQPVRRPDAPRPVARGHAAKLQRRASDLAESIEEKNETGISARLRRFQRHQVERQMAGLRSEAVQARRLAEHIENLSRDAAAQQRKRKPVMTTDTNIVDPGHAQRLKRRADDRPAPGGSQMSFNPLHPSMELPPEQLIRLLGMESKKTRKVRKSRKAAAPAPAKKAQHQAKPQQAPEPAPAAPEPAATPRKESHRKRSRQHEDLQPSVFDDKRRNLLIPALVVGVVAGIAVSAYLLWSQPVPVAEQKPVTASTAPAQKQKSQTASQPLNRKPAAKPAASTPAPAMNIQQQAQWQAAIEKEKQRLQADAEQRLAKRIRQLEAAAAAAPEPESTVLPAENTQTRPTDYEPATSIQSLPSASFERLLDKPFTTIDTPAAQEPESVDLPAET
ncbi:MAG TPA: hypothetical protein ENJ80_06450, partial [Gammaproteobacteria bacterium]|nr:hypothetical protein [Gammaproteobacteria bacterium]